MSTLCNNISLTLPFSLQVSQFSSSTNPRLPSPEPEVRQSSPRLLRFVARDVARADQRDAGELEEGVAGVKGLWSVRCAAGGGERKPRADCLLPSQALYTVVAVELAGNNKVECSPVGVGPAEATF